MSAVLQQANSDVEQDTKCLIEAALFVTGKAMSSEELSQATGIASLGYISKALKELQNDYEIRAGSLRVIEIGGKYMLTVAEPYASKVNGLAGQPDITRGALRILAYVSRNEPVYQTDVVKAFGSSTYDYMRELVENDFVTAKRVGRTKKLQTTNKFKEYFSLGEPEKHESQ